MSSCSPETRRRAVRMYQRGYSQAEVAAALGVHQVSVSNWVQRAAAGDDLGDRPHYKATPSRIRRLICELYQRHPEWTLYRIATAVSDARWPGGQHRTSHTHVRQVLEEEGLVDA